ncbi:MAG: hypothetical protein OEY72_13630 [Gammaproteobacteria bacterium]|nr:hypothetical protein [Gammaproteobacteria bacterium]
MDKRLLAILCCPVTHKGLSLANAEQLRKVNAAIAEGKLQNQEGVALSTALREALVTDDGKRLYPVADGIPVLLEGEAVSLEQLDAA